jgi:hypothetical protein
MGVFCQSRALSALANKGHVTKATIEKRRSDGA